MCLWPEMTKLMCIWGVYLQHPFHFHRTVSHIQVGPGDAGMQAWGVLEDPGTVNATKHFLRAPLAGTWIILSLCYTRPLSADGNFLPEPFSSSHGFAFIF
jgi:hypothetical protein